MKTALLSVYQKTEELAAFARALQERGWQILASSGTQKFLAERGIPSVDVASLVGEPILGHRVVTLSREIHAGVLARPEDEDELKRLSIRRIDLVYIDLYPLEEEIANPAATEESVIEKTDIGGPALLRSAAKGRRIVLSSAEQFEQAVRYIDSGKQEKKYLASLAAKAEARAGEYAIASARYTERLT